MKLVNVFISTCVTDCSVLCSACILFQCHEMALSSHEEIVKVLSELQNVSLPLLTTFPE